MAILHVLKQIQVVFADSCRKRHQFNDELHEKFIGSMNL